MHLEIGIGKYWKIELKILENSIENIRIINIIIEMETLESMATDNANIGC